MGDRKQEPSYTRKAEFYRDRKKQKKGNRRVEEAGKSGKKEIDAREPGNESREDITESRSDRKEKKKDTLHSVYDKLHGFTGRKIVKQNEELLADRDVQGVGFLKRRVAKAIYVTSTIAIIFSLIIAIPCMAVMGFVSLFETPLSITLPSMEDETVDGVKPVLEEASGLYRDFYIDFSDKMEKFDEVEYIGEDNLEWVVKVYDLRVPEGENACDMDDPSHKDLLKMTFDQMVTCETTYGYKEVGASEVEGYTGYWYYSEYDEEGNPTKAMVQYCKYKITYLTAEEWRQKHQWATIQEEFWDEIMAYDLGDISEYQQNSRPGNVANYRAIGGETQLDIYHFLLDSGMTAAGACGVMGNLMTESGFNPNAVSDSGTYHGIAQWGNGRWSDCVNGGYSGSLEGQLNYLVMEMSTQYGDVWSYVTTTGDPIEAANRVAAYYEICPGNAGNAAEYNGTMYQGLADRRGYAQSFFEVFGMSGA